MAMIPTRNGYGEALLELAKIDPRLVILDADVAKSISTNKFHKQFPERAFNIGIAEQNVFGMAAGLATTGRTVFASTYAVFASMRAAEQIRTYISYPRLNVKIGASHAGLHTGMDGVTHQAIEDIGIVHAMPGITILSPSDAPQARELTIQAASYPGPVYIRLNRNPVPIVHPDGQKPEIGKAIVLREYGDDVTIAAHGIMVSRALAAAEELKKRGIGARVLEFHTIRPLDRGQLLKAARETGAVVVAEDHNINGGLGSIVASFLAENHPVPVKRIGLQDVFGESGDPDILLAAYNMDTPDIVRASEQVVSQK